MSEQLVNVLLVDDNDIDAELVMRACHRQGIPNPITRVSDGYQALDALRGEGGRSRLPRPYVVMLDINMPRMNGLEFLDAIREDSNLCHSVVYLLITDETDKERFAAYDTQVTGYIQKQNIVSEIRAVLWANDTMGK